jgi:hypothetical protein
LSHLPRKARDGGSTPRHGHRAQSVPDVKDVPQADHACGSRIKQLRTSAKTTRWD